MGKQKLEGLSEQQNNCIGVALKYSVELTILDISCATIRLSKNIKLQILCDYGDLLVYASHKVKCTEK